MARAMHYPREALNDSRRQAGGLCEAAFLSPHFNAETAYSLLDGGNQRNLIDALLGWARDTYELYLFPYDNDVDLIPTIRSKLDQLTNKQITQ